MVLPWVPATATHPAVRPSPTARPADRGSIRSPRRAASTYLGVVLADRGGDDHGVGVADVRGVVAEVAR